MFCSYPADGLDRLDRGSDVTGDAVTVDIGGTIDLARNFRPGLRRLAVVAGTGPLDFYLTSLAREIFKKNFHGQLEWIDLTTDPDEKNNVADQNPEIVRDLESRLLAYAKEQKPSEWIKAQPAFVGEQGKTVFDPDFDITDGSLMREKPVLPKK